MNFGNMGFMEILLILVVVLLLFGAKRLPEIGASMGKGIREYKKSISDDERSLLEPEREGTKGTDYRTPRVRRSRPKRDLNPKDYSAETGNWLLGLVTRCENPRDASPQENGIPRVLHNE